MRVAAFLLLATSCFAQKASWLFTVRTSPMDDSRAYILHTPSVKSLSTAPAELIIRCREGNVDALVSTDEPVDWENGTVSIRTRLDNFDPSDEDWNRVESDKGFILTDYEAEKFVKDVAGSRILRIEYKSLLKQHRYIVAFNVSGLRSRLSQLHGCLESKPIDKSRACLSNLDSGCTDDKGVFHPMGRPR